ncbi:MAG: EamA family transporter [Proteobacteria bacterium]|nr:EamA family transporter [Pseudomonadota bacterium]
MPMKHNSSMNSLEWGMLILLSSLWGASFFFMKVALAELPTFTIVFSRVCIATLALLILI